jgi:lactoylglutathione lyase
MAVRLNHMSVNVRDLARSAKFYSEVLRLPEIENGTRQSNIRWFGLGAGQSVHLIEGDPGPTFVTISTHFCISASDWPSALEHLQMQGVAYCNVKHEKGKVHVRADGVRSVYFQDPDGYWIELNEDFAIAD